MTTLFTDNFNRTNGALGADWTDVDAGFSISSNTASIAAGLSSALNGTTTYPNDQWGQVTLVTMSPNADEGGGVILRAGSGSDLYFCHCSTADSHIYSRVGGTYTSLGTGPSFATTDVVYFEIQGTTLLLKKNGSTVIGPLTDSSIASGKAGIWADGAGNVSVDDFSAGDFAGALVSIIGQACL